MRFPIILLSLFLLLTAAVPDRARQANEAFENRDFETAERLFREAINENPNDARLYFNHGTTLAIMGRQDEAVEAFERFRMIERNPAKRAMADYNIGNIFADSDEWEMAAELFRMALLQNPEDEDAIHNFEFAMRQLHQPQDEEDQLPPEGQEQQQDEQADRSEQQDDSDPDDGEGQAGDDQSDPAESRQSPDATEPEPRPGEMSPQEAQQILNAITNRERELIRDFLRDLTPPAQTQEKDW